MLAIEHNPTHIETTLSEGREAHGEQIENQFEGITRKKGRKNGAMGVFSKLLAGLVSKKTLMQGNPKRSAEETAESGTKQAAFLQLTEGKGQKNPKISLSAAGESKQNEVNRNQSLDGKPLNFEFARLFPAGEKETQSLSFETVSLKTEISRQVKEPSERRIPFKKGEMAEDKPDGEVRSTSFQPKSNKEENVPLDGADVKKAGRKRPSLEIHDLRTQPSAESGMIAERGLKGSEEMRNGPEREISVELRPSGERNEKPAEGVQKVPAGENFEQLLARELRGDLSTDIVRQAAIILRDGGEGTIKLSLKPETLGKVKIHLEMAENRISGHIFVENEEALRAFEKEIHTLEQSFKDSGFEASLNAALDYQEGGQRWKEKEVQPFFSGRLAASYEESGSMEFSGEFSTGFGINAVNVLA